MLINKKTREPASPPYVHKKIVYPNNIEQLMSDDELAAIGLERAPEQEQPPVDAPPSAIVISRRQFYHALAARSIIERDDARAALRIGEIPEALVAILDTLEDPDQQFAAELHLTGSNDFVSDHPLVSLFAASQGWDADQIREFFTEAAQL